METLRKHILKGAMATNADQAAEFLEQLQQCKRAPAKMAGAHCFLKGIPADAFSGIGGDTSVMNNGFSCVYCAVP